jgi:hypothetical protein
MIENDFESAGDTELWNKLASKIEKKYLLQRTEN